MEGFWCAFSNWGQDGHSYQQDPHVVHVHLSPHPWITHHCLHDPGLLDEHQTLHESEKKKSIVVSLSVNLTCFFWKILTLLKADEYFGCQRKQ